MRGAVLQCNYYIFLLGDFDIHLFCRSEYPSDINDLLLIKSAHDQQLNLEKSARFKRNGIAGNVLDGELTDEIADILPDNGMGYFYRQLDFPSEPGVANEILENEPKSCLTVA